VLFFVSEGHGKMEGAGMIDTAAVLVCDGDLTSLLLLRRRPEEYL